jgi:hypothetical protein
MGRKPKTRADATGCLAPGGLSEPDSCQAFLGSWRPQPRPDDDAEGLVYNSAYIFGSVPIRGSRIVRGRLPSRRTSVSDLHPRRARRGLGDEEEPQRLDPTVAALRPSARLPERAAPTASMASWGVGLANVARASRFGSRSRSRQRRPEHCAGRREQGQERFVATRVRRERFGSEQSPEVVDMAIPPLSRQGMARPSREEVTVGPVRENRPAHRPFRTGHAALSSDFFGNLPLLSTPTRTTLGAVDPSTLTRHHWCPAPPKGTGRRAFKSSHLDVPRNGTRCDWRWNRSLGLGGRPADIASSSLGRTGVNHPW